jgi:hypothetical protein
MKETRLRWNVVGKLNFLDEPIQAGVWFPDNAQGAAILSGAGFFCATLLTAHIHFPAYP